MASKFINSWFSRVYTDIDQSCLNAKYFTVVSLNFGSFSQWLNLSCGPPMFLNYSYVFNHPQRSRGCDLISYQGGRAPVFSILDSIFFHRSIALLSSTEFPIKLK